MLPRIGSALAQFIAPISSSGAQGQKSVRKRSRSNLETPLEQKHPQKPRGRGAKGQQALENPPEEFSEHPPEPGAQAIPFPGSEGNSTEPSPSAPAPPLPSSASQSLASSFLQIFNLFQFKRSHLLRWLGWDAYDHATRIQKKGGKFKKGTMLDEQVE